MKTIAYDHLIPGVTIEQTAPLLIEEVVYPCEQYKAGFIKRY